MGISPVLPTPSAQKFYVRVQRSHEIVLQIMTFKRKKINKICLSGFPFSHFSLPAWRARGVCRKEQYAGILTGSHDSRSPTKGGKDKSMLRHLPHSSIDLWEVNGRDSLALICCCPAPCVVIYPSAQSEHSTHSPWQEHFTPTVHRGRGLHMAVGKLAPRG